MQVISHSSSSLDREYQIHENKSKVLLQIIYCHCRSFLGLTEQEIGNLPDETRVYESVGRMFILSDKPAVTSRLTEKQTTSQEKVISDTLLVQEIGCQRVLLQDFKCNSFCI